MRPTTNQIREIFKSVIKKKPAGGSFFAWLGRGDGTVLANDNNGVYIIDFNGNVQIVLNTKVPLYPFRLVEVGYISESSKILEVKRLVDAYPDNRPTALPNHEKHHEWGGVDTLWVRPEQIMVGLCIPDDTDPMTVQFIGFVFYLNGFHLINNFSLDMTAYVPTDGAAWVLLQTDESGVVTTVTGTTKDSWTLLEYEDIPEPETGKKPLVAIRLYDGQSQIWKTKARSDIVDLRWSGYSVGGGGAVETVTGDGVDNTDPTNPVISYPTPADIGADLAGAAATAETNAKAYADGLVVGLWDDRGSYDASGGAYPSSGGSGTAGAILKGDIWTISVAGTLPTGQVVEVGDVVRALVDTPGNTQANWAITQNNIGYVAENSANKATSMTGNETSNILYLTAKAIYDWATGLFVQKNAGITGATKTKITYDAKGLVTAGADLSSSDIPNLDASKITSGTLDAARLPTPTTLAIGGVKRNTGGAGEYVTGIDSSGNLIYDTPAVGVGNGWTAYSSVIPTRIPSPLDGTFTVTIASPAVFTKTSHGLITGSKIRLTTTGALPTGLATGTDYFVVRLSANTFGVATSLANAVAETPTRVNTSGSQSGTHSIVHQTDPGYWLQFAGVDLTSVLYFGMPIKLEQNSIVRYGFICTVPSYSGGNTSFMVLTRCDSTTADYDILDTGTYAITNFNYGLPKLPGLGFPLSDDNWKLNILNETNGSKTSPTAGVTYNPANVALVLPPGVWDISSGGRAWTTFPSTPQRSVFAGCSSAQDSFSDSELAFTFVAEGTTVVAQLNHVRKTKTLSTETTFFHLVRTDTGSATTIQQFGAAGVGTYISAVSGFLH